MERIPQPTRRTIVVVLVISSVLLAGCSGLGGDSATDSENEPNDSNEAAEVNNTTSDPAEANNTSASPEEANNTTDANQTDPPNTDNDSEMNESDSDADESAAPETDSESETNDTTDSNGSQDTADTSSTDETEESDESEESDGTSESDETDETEESDGTTEDTEYASPEDVSVEGVTHMESDSSLEHDEVTLTNTNDERPLPIGGWEIGFEGTDQRIPIEENTVIEPGESHTVQLEDGEKVLNEDGGVVHLYDADGNHVGSWDHIGSPSGPPEADDGDDTGYVQVEVVDAESGEALEDAEVTLEEEGANEASTGSTDGAGITTVRELSSGEYELTVEHEGYTNHSETVTVDEAGTEMTVELESSDSGAAALQIVPVGAVSTGSA